MNVVYEFGKHSQRVFDANILVLSPGVPTQADVVQEAQSRGIEIVSEIELASWFCQVPIIAVTGTNGKTTTTALSGKIFSDAGWQTTVAGNIGTAFSDFVVEPQKTGVVVLEVSSYQLDHIHLFHPHVSIITTITQDHLDRYNLSYDQYIESKKRIFMNQTSSDVLIYNADYEHAQLSVQSAGDVRVIPISTQRIISRGGWIENNFLLINLGDGNEEITSTSEMVMRGAHNYPNVLMSSIAARVMDISINQISRTCKSFPGVEHRLEFVREMNGVKFINDSKATNVDSVIVAVQSFTEPIIIIAGGRDKGSPYDPLFTLVSSQVKKMILIGEAADRMENAFRGKTIISRARSMEEAVQEAQRSATKGDIVLLSPACASFDMFKNFEHRGEVFKQAVMQLKEKE